MSDPSARRFDVGARALVIAANSPNRGEIVTIVKVHRNAVYRNVGPGGAISARRIAPVLYEVDLEPPHGFACIVFEPRDLVPIGDCYDAGRWSESVWRPKGLTA